MLANQTIALAAKWLQLLNDCSDWLAQVQVLQSHRQKDVILKTRTYAALRSSSHKTNKKWDIEQENAQKI